MGINYSKVTCVDETARCSQVTPIPYPIYSRNTTGQTPTQIHQYVCGGKPGIVQQCCDPFDPASSHPVSDGQLVRVVHDQKGQPTEYLVCDCGSNPACQQQFCPNFKVATQYERCRARAVDTQQQVNVSPHVYKVVASNTFPNCYGLCGKQ